MDSNQPTTSSSSHLNSNTVADAEARDDGFDFDTVWLHIEPYVTKHDDKLMRLIMRQPPGSSIDASKSKLKDEAMGDVVKYAIFHQQCERLNLWGNQLTAKGVTILAPGLLFSGRLTELDLAHNQLSDAGVDVLWEILSSDRCKLKDIDLSNNNIGNRGAESFADVLRQNGTLERLALNNNQIRDDGLFALTNAADSDQSALQELRLEGNPSITRENMEQVAESCTRLSEVYLRGQRLRDSGLSPFGTNCPLVLIIFS